MCLQILSENTRRTKMVALASGTHRYAPFFFFRYSPHPNPEDPTLSPLVRTRDLRAEPGGVVLHSVPEELRRHSLGDDEGNEYSTNLDRNRYGSDDQYLSTVIRYDLEFLGLCPALVDVEIIDAKKNDAPLLISAGDAGCMCRGDGAGGVHAGAGHRPFKVARRSSVHTVNTPSPDQGGGAPPDAGPVRKPGEGGMFRAFSAPSLGGLGMLLDIMGAQDTQVRMGSFTRPRC